MKKYKSYQISFSYQKLSFLKTEPEQIIVDSRFKNSREYFFPETMTRATSGFLDVDIFYLLF